MTDNEAQSHSLIERWADAVRAGEMDTVLADHADDIVMFDAPPPYEHHSLTAKAVRWATSGIGTA
jgi:ketosteroid isomerase-like protein